MKLVRCWPCFKKVSDLATSTQAIGGRQLGIHSMPLSSDWDVPSRSSHVSVYQVPPGLAFDCLTSTLSSSRLSAFPAVQPCLALCPGFCPCHLAAWKQMKVHTSAVWASGLFLYLIERLWLMQFTPKEAPLIARFLLFEKNKIKLRRLNHKCVLDEVVKWPLIRYWRKNHILDMAMLDLYTPNPQRILSSQRS